MAVAGCSPHRRLPLGEIADRVLAAARAHGAQSDDQTMQSIRRRA